LLSDRFTQAIATALRRGEHLAVYFIDVDKFKAINDTHGHHVGDEVLRTVARRLLQACRASDTVARLGGDEFIVLRTAPPKAKPEALAARLRAHLAAPFDVEGLQLGVSVGIGISVYPQDGKDERTLLESADAALYAAKACGAGSIRRFGVEDWARALSAVGLDRRPLPAEPAPARPL
jgi:diguanylate cyclase (GGDEF)-like protein